MNLTKFFTKLEKVNPPIFLLLIETEQMSKLPNRESILEKLMSIRRNVLPR